MIAGATLPKRVVQKGKSMFQTIAEIVGNAVLIPSQSSLDDRFTETKIGNSSSKF